MLNVLINNNDGTSLSLKHVKSGESVTSLLSFIDVLAVSFFLLYRDSIFRDSIFFLVLKF